MNRLEDLDTQTIKFLKQIKTTPVQSGLCFRVIAIYKLSALDSFYVLDCKTREEANQELVAFHNKTTMPIIYEEIYELPCSFV